MTPETKALLIEAPDRLVAVFRRFHGQELALVLQDDPDTGRVVELRLASIAGSQPQAIPVGIARLPELIEALQRAQAQAERLGWIDPRAPARRLAVREAVGKLRDPGPDKRAGRPTWSASDEF